MKTNFISVLLIFLIVSLSGCMIAIGISAFNEIKGNNPAKDLETSFSSSIEKKEDVETPQIVEGAIDSGNNDFASNISYQSSQSQKRYFYNRHRHGRGKNFYNSFDIKKFNKLKNKRGLF